MARKQAKQKKKKEKNILKKFKLTTGGNIQVKLRR